MLPRSRLWMSSSGGPTRRDGGEGRLTWKGRWLPPRRVTSCHFPPHLSGKVLKAIQPGEAVTLYGVRPRATEMLACIALESTRGTRIDDVGPPPKMAKRPNKDNEAHSPGLRPLDIEDSVDRLLHGPKGEVRGVAVEGIHRAFPAGRGRLCLPPSDSEGRSCRSRKRSSGLGHGSHRGQSPG